MTPIARLLVSARGSTLAGVLALALLTSSCSGASHVEATAKPVGGAAQTAPGNGTAGPTPEVTETPTAVIPKPADPLAGTYIPVKRGAKAPTPTISAPPGSFTKPVQYSDLTVVQVVSIKQGEVSGKGPGVFPGQPTTTVVLRLTNGSTRAISLNQVVVTATYGTPKRLARPVYDSSAKDFGGIANRGSSVDATYVFSIPTEQLAAVVLFVDFDGVHLPATIAGSAR